MNLDAIRERWQNLSRNRKIIILSLGVSIFIIGVLLTQWLTKVEYVPLMTDLEARDAGAIRDKLAELNIPYQLGAQGDSILVPSEQVHEVRLQLASEGILAGGGMGFELFDETKLGVTDFERRLNYQRALQEELRRTIAHYEEVESVRVHIVLPEKSVFVENESEASASIAIKLKPLAKLKPDQVKGIIYLVSSSVEGLPVERVNVIDLNGNVLSEDVLEPGNGSPAKVTLTQQEAQREFEKDLEKRVQGMLEKILGPGKAVAMVSAELDFNQQETTEITYGENGVIISEKVVEDSSKTTGEQQVTTGTGANNNPDTYPVVEPGSSETDHSDRTTNYEHNQQKVSTIKAPGTLKRLSTAVTVDGELDAGLVAQVEQMVSAAIGYSQERGDQIVVSNMNFDTSAMDKLNADMEKAAQQEAENLRREAYMKWGSIAAVALVVLVVVLLILRARRKEKLQQELDILLDEPIQIKDIDTNPAVATMESGGAFDNHTAMKDMALKNPEEVANLLKVWLSEDRGGA